MKKKRIKQKKNSQSDAAVGMGIPTVADLRETNKKGWTAGGHFSSGERR